MGQWNAQSSASPSLPATHFDTFPLLSAYEPQNTFCRGAWVLSLREHQEGNTGLHVVHCSDFLVPIFSGPNIVHPESSVAKTLTRERTGTKNT